MYFTVEEENLICMYHNADRRRTIGRITVVSRVMRKIVYGSGRNLLQGAA